MSTFNGEPFPGCWKEKIVPIEQSKLIPAFGVGIEEDLKLFQERITKAIAIPKSCLENIPATNYVSPFAGVNCHAIDTKDHNFVTNEKPYDTNRLLSIIEDLTNRIIALEKQLTLVKNRTETSEGDIDKIYGVPVIWNALTPNTKEPETVETAYDRAMKPIRK